MFISYFILFYIHCHRQIKNMIWTLWFANLTFPGNHWSSVHRYFRKCVETLTALRQTGQLFCDPKKVMWAGIHSSVHGRMCVVCEVVVKRCELLAHYQHIFLRLATKLAKKLAGAAWSVYCCILKSSISLVTAKALGTVRHTQFCCLRGSWTGTLISVCQFYLTVCMVVLQLRKFLGSLFALILKLNSAFYLMKNGMIQTIFKTAYSLWS